MTKVVLPVEEWKRVDPDRWSGHSPAMAESERKRADARLEAALQGADQTDPRPHYRPALRYLKHTDDAAFRRVLGYYEDTLVPTVAGEADPLAAWREYGGVLTEELGPGRLLELDSTGRARGTASVDGARGMVVYVPDSPTAPVLILREPKDATPAQTAAKELLVDGRQTASRYQG